MYSCTYNTKLGFPFYNCFPIHVFPENDRINVKLLCFVIERYALNTFLVNLMSLFCVLEIHAGSAWNSGHCYCLYNTYNIQESEERQLSVLFALLVSLTHGYLDTNAKLHVTLVSVQY